MKLGYYGILIIFVAFFLLLILNPNLSCFGKRLKSPFYPLFRRKKRVKEIKTEDYGFSLVDEGERRKMEGRRQMKDSSPDSASDKGEEGQATKKRKKKIKTHDYGFSLGEEEDK
ncbi:MAG: hypothetical protein JSV46_06330 [Candidatus Aminicenantes bacterium]|nr:MAG: hypothetical protein JSV46_06330 [Candidatus Aminicenantes bacterium]